MIEQSLIKTNFQRAFLNDYDDNAPVQEHLAKKVVALVTFSDINISTSKVLEIGSGSGILTTLFLKKFVPAFYVANDIVDTSPFGLLKEGFSTKNLHYTQKDFLTLEPTPYDLILSSSSLHWIGDIKTLAPFIHERLSKNGLFIGNVFLENNLSEISEVLNTEGLFYASKKAIKKTMEKYFSLERWECETNVLLFAEMRELFKHFKQIGSNSLKKKGKKEGFQQFLSKKRAKSFQELSYSSVTVVCRKK